MDVRKSFDNFDEFKKFFDSYQTETKQLFVIKKSKSVDAVNKKLDSDSTKYNDCLKWKYLWYQCKNGGQPRLAGGSERPNQRYVIVTKTVIGAG